MSLFKEPFNDAIKTQLENRQNLMGRKGEYTSQDITYLNSKTSWVSLKSSTDVEFTDELARNNVLFGGLGKYDNNNLFNKSEYAYFEGKNSPLGIKPMPGISNVSIKNKGAYGSLRQATVNFQCWDVNQLEQLDLLYMRPGFTVLLEWGWLPYIDNENGGKLSNRIYQDDKFFTRKDIDLQDYFKELKTLVSGSGGNYDFMFGYVMNYSWKLRDDGGYDCSTEIISTGEVLESYKINFAAPEISAKSFKNTGTLFSDVINLADNEEIELIRKDYSQNIIRGICSELFFIAKSNENISSGISPFTYKYENNNYDVNFLSLDFKTNSSKTDVKKCSINDDKKNIYITLKDFVTLINNFVLIKNPNNSKKVNVISLSVNDRAQSSKGSNEPLTCLYHPLQTSLDPTVCLIKNPGFLRTLLENKPPEDVITYKVQEATPDQKSIAINIRNKINTENISGDKLKFYLKENITDINTLLSIDKIYSELYPNSLYNDIHSKLYDPDIDTLFGTFDFPKLNAVSKTKPSQFLILPDKTRKEAIKNAQDAINKKNEKTYTETVKAAISYFEKIDSVSGNSFVNNDGKTGIIGNIYINLKYIYLLADNSSLEDQDQSEKNNIELITFLRTMLRDVQSSIGNVNNFEIFNEDNIGYIIDLNSSSEDIKPFEFQVGNRNSIIRSINLESQIFSNQSTIIAISAQSDSGKLGLENSSMVAYNRGLTDRMISKKDVNLGDSSVKIKENGFSILLNNLKSFFQNLSTDSSYFDPLGNPSLNVENIGTYKNALRDAIVFFTSQFKADNKYKDILPTKLSITIDGIGGIIIGNIFDLSKNVFPSSYVGVDPGIKLYYTVTGIGQDISNDGQWITTIEGNPFIPDSSFDINKPLTINGNSISYEATPASMVWVNTEKVNEPPLVFSESVSRMCKSMNNIFKGKTIIGNGACGRWTYSIARNFVEAKTKPQNMLPGTGNGSGGNAKEQGYRDFLKQLGYKEVAILNKIDKATLARRLDTAPYQIGDVVIYWSDNPIKGKQENAYIYGHTQIYTGGVRYDPILKSNIVDPKQIRWACDDTYNYGTNFVYRSAVNVNTNLPESWNFYLLRL